VQPDGNIVCFRYCPENHNGDLNVLNAAIRNKSLKDARFYIVQTMVNGKVYLRVSLMNPFTTLTELNALITAIREDFA
jgi:L-2,4-diaminobutyrate decarboxylase